MNFLGRVLAAPPPWAHSQLEHAERHPEIDTRMRFITRRDCIMPATLDVFRVVGTGDERYAACTWLDLLRGAERIGSRLAQLEADPSYYEQPITDHPPAYFSFDGQRWFIGGDGHHRTVIARFLFAIEGRARTALGGVTLMRYHVDDELRAISRELGLYLAALRLPWELRNAHRSRTTEYHAAGYTEHTGLDVILRSLDSPWRGITLTRTDCARILERVHHCARGGRIAGALRRHALREELRRLECETPVGRDTFDPLDEGARSR